MVIFRHFTLPLNPFYFKVPYIGMYFYCIDEQKIVNKKYIYEERMCPDLIGNYLNIQLL